MQTIDNILFDPTIGRIVTTAFGIIVVVIIFRFLRRAVGSYVKDTDTRYRVRKAISFLGYVVAIFLISVIYSDQLSGLTVALGVAGAGIAFALQEVVASIAGWVAISFAGFYKTGDRVQLGGIKGDVIDVGILRTTLMEVGQWVNGDLYNGRIVRIANSFVFKEPVFNYSADFHFLWDEITLPVRFGSDTVLARRLLEEVVNEITGEFAAGAKQEWQVMVKKYLVEDARIEPMVTLIANDNWIEFTVRYVVDFRMRRGTKDKLFVRILDEIEKTGGKIQLASATFELVGLPPITVRSQLSGNKGT